MRRLALAALVTAAGMAGTTAASASTLNLSLDGFCNTFAWTLDGFEIYGTRGGCGYTVIDGGTAAAKIGTVKYDIVSDTQDGTTNVFMWYFTPPKHKAGSWFLYSSTGTAFTEVNSGTYTVTASGAANRPGADVTTMGKRASRTLPTH